MRLEPTAHAVKFGRRISSSGRNPGGFSRSAYGLQSFKVSTLLRFAHSASLRQRTEYPLRGLWAPKYRKMSGLKLNKLRLKALLP